MNCCLFPTFLIPLLYMIFNAYQIITAAASIFGLIIMWMNGEWDYALFPIAIIVGCCYSIFTRRDAENKRLNNVSPSVWDYFFNLDEEWGCDEYETKGQQEIRYKRNNSPYMSSRKCKKSKIKIEIEKPIQETP